MHGVYEQHGLFVECIGPFEQCWSKVKLQIERPVVPPGDDRVYGMIPVPIQSRSRSASPRCVTFYLYLPFRTRPVPMAITITPDILSADTAAGVNAKDRPVGICLDERDRRSRAVSGFGPESSGGNLSLP